MPSPFDEVDPFFDPDEATAASWSARGMPAVPGLVWQVEPGVDLLEQVSTTDYSIAFRVSQWPAVQPSDRVTIGAVIYEVRRINPIDDGLLARAALRRLN